MSDHWQYALNSTAWLVLGVVASSIYWRVWYHKQFVRAGGPKEPPLAVFVALLVLLMSTAGLLFAESARLALATYVTCQGQVNNTNVKTINDRSTSAQKQLVGEISFYKALYAELTAGPAPTVRQTVARSLAGQIAQDTTRLRVLQTNPLQPISTCHQTHSN